MFGKTLCQNYVYNSQLKKRNNTGHQLKWLGREWTSVKKKKLVFDLRFGLIRATFLTFLTFKFVHQFSPFYRYFLSRVSHLFFLCFLIDGRYPGRVLKLSPFTIHSSETNAACWRRPTFIIILVFYVILWVFLWVLVWLYMMRAFCWARWP